MKKFNVCVIGCGEFSRFFVPLFQAHPYVGETYVCDLDPEKTKEYQRLFHVSVINTFDEAISRKDIDAVAIFVQRHLHGPLVCAALEAGKHVYSAVPMASSIEDCAKIVSTVEKTGLVYMMGETCIYYPCSMFCKKEYESGRFGRFTYGEAQYHHDFSHFSAQAKQAASELAIPPFYYSTHSISMLLNAVGDHVVKVSGVGYRDVEPNTPFAKGKNNWDNEFSNEFSLMQLSKGGTIRVNEMRRVGYKAPSSYVSAFYGTEASYQFSNAQHIVTKLTPEGVELEDVSDEVNPYSMTEHKNDADFKNKVANHTWQWSDVSPVQASTIMARTHLTEEYRNLPSGHMNSHKLLIDDFCSAVHNKSLPIVNAWLAARFTVPGLVAHESAPAGGVLMDVPDFGDPIEGYLK